MGDVRDDEPVGPDEVGAGGAGAGGAGAEAGAGEAGPGRRSRWRWAAALVLLLLVPLGVAGGALAFRSGTVLPGTSLAGTDVSGLQRPEVEAVAREAAAARSEGILVLTAEGSGAEGEDVEVDLDRSLVSVDVEGTVDRALASGRSSLWEALLGSLGVGVGDPVDLVVEVDAPALTKRLDEVADGLDAEPVTGGFEVGGTRVLRQDPVPGRRLNRAAAREEALQALLEGAPGPLPLPVEEVAPPVTARDVDRVVKRARAALQSPFVLRREGLRGDSSLTVTPEELAPLLASTLRGEELVFEVDEAGLGELVSAAAAELDRAPVDASVSVRGSPPVFDVKGSAKWSPRPAEVDVAPSVAGLAVDVDAATAALVDLVTSGVHEGELPAVVTEPRISTEDLSGVKSLVGTFTTYFQAGQPRATNIRRIAEIVDGTLVLPGEVFSLNDAAGRRTRERGFVADGTIVDGELVDEVGGGVSQFATTIFNAAFFAGLDIEEYQPHSFYISRYPAGRESTVYFGQIDVKFLNDTKHPIFVQTSSTRSSVTVSLYGDNGGRLVEAVHGPRRNQSRGGFDVKVTRIVSGGDGVGGRRVFSTSYDPPPEE